MLSANGKKYDRIEPFLEYIRTQTIGKEMKFLISSADGKNQREVKLKLVGLK